MGSSSPRPRRLEKAREALRRLAERLSTPLHRERASSRHALCAAHPLRCTGGTSPLQGHGAEANRGGRCGRCALCSFILSISVSLPHHVPHVASCDVLRRRKTRNSFRKK